MQKLAYWSSLVLIFVIPWENVILVPGIGTLSKVVGLFAACVWGVAILSTGRFRKPNPVLLAILSFLAWNVVSILWATDAESAVVHIKSYVLIGGMALMIWDIYRSESSVRMGMQIYVLGAFVSVAGIFWNYKSGVTVSVGRTSVTGFNPNDVGLIIALGIAMSWHLATTSHAQSKWQQLLCLINFAYLPLAIVAIMQTGSRSAFVAAMPAVAFAVCTLPRFRCASIALALCCLGALVLIVPVVVPHQTFERIAEIPSSVQQKDLTGRFQIWQETVPAVASRPLCGFGAGSFESIHPTGRVSHNVFVSVLVETGAIGFLLLCLVMILAFHAIWHQPFSFARPWIIMLLVLGLGAMVHDWEQRKHAWFIIMLGTCGAYAHQTVRLLASRLAGSSNLRFAPETCALADQSALLEPVRGN